MGHRLLLSFSLANLFFIRVWHKLLYGKGYFSAVPVAYDVSALLACLVLLTGLNYALLRGADHRLAPVQHACRLLLLAVLFIPANFIRYSFGFSASSLLRATDIRTAVATVSVLLAPTGYLLCRYREGFFRAFQVLLLLLFPYALLNLAQAALLLPGADATAARPASRSARQLPGGKKIVWLVFDETDKRLAFDERPAGVNLPEFDRFAAEALVAEHAFPPAGETLRSLPALISGRLISFARPRNANDLTVVFDGETAGRSLSTTENVFSKVRARGYGAGLAGFYHPYSRMLGTTLDFCSTRPFELFHDSDPGFGGAMLRDFDYAVILSEAIQFNRRGEIRHHIELYQEVLASGSRGLADNRLNLLMIHLPVPHLPATYDRKTMRFRDADSGRGDYFDNLVLADRTLGILRRQLEQQGRWEASTVIISSDHWWRGSQGYDNKVDHRVPFMLKLPGRHQRLTYEKSFNTVNTAQLVLDILDDRVRKPEDAIKWLNTHSTFGPSPYYNKL